MNEEPQLKKFIIYVCELCLALEGESCNVPGCAMIRLPMDLIETILNTLELRN